MNFQIKSPMSHDHSIDSQKTLSNYFLNILPNSFNIFEVLKVISLNRFTQIWFIQYTYMMTPDVSMLINLDLMTFF